MNLKRALLSVLLSLSLLAFVSCASQSTVTPPATPTNIQMATLSKALADGASTASKTVIALRDGGKITQAETVTVQNYILVALSTDKAMNAELVSSDDWPTQRAKIIQLWAASGLTAAKANLSTTAGLVLDTIISVVNQIMATIGGPTIGGL